MFESVYVCMTAEGEREAKEKAEKSGDEELKRKVCIGLILFIHI